METFPYDGEQDVLLTRDWSDVMCEPTLTTNEGAKGTYWRNLAPEAVERRLAVVFAAMRL